MKHLQVAFFYLLVFINGNTAFTSSFSSSFTSSVLSPNCPYKRDESACKVEPKRLKILYAFPNKKNQFLESVGWFSKPFPNSLKRPYLMAFSQFTDTQTEANFILDLKTGKSIRVPGDGDPIATPDGKFFTVSGAHSAGKGLTFYLASDLLKGFSRGAKKNLHDLKPIFTDPEVLGYYQSFGILSSRFTFEVNPQKKKIKVLYTRYRVLHSDGGPFQITEYEVLEKEGKVFFQRKLQSPLCANLKNYKDNTTAMLSKDGKLASAYDGKENVTRIFDLIVKEEKITCIEAFSLGFPTGKLDFSYDGHWIAFHVNFLSDDYGDGPITHVPSTKIKDVILAKLEKKDGKTIGIDQFARLTTSVHRGEGSYFPAFLPNGKLFYVHQNNENKKASNYRFEVVDPYQAHFVRNYFLSQKLKQGKTARTFLGALWGKVCHNWELTPTQSFWYSITLDKKSCVSLVAENFDACFLKSKGEFLTREEAEKICLEF